MRKQTKLVAVLSAAALLAIGASMTSFAAKGWVEEGGQWYYYNNNGDYVSNEWKKSGNNWFWLGDDGAMVTDTLVEDGDYYYYVNANGAMVTNSWVAVEPGEDDYEDNAPDHYWYYFGANGKAYKAGDSGLSIKTINGKKYGFDQDSKMVYGFVQENGTKNTDENPFELAMYYFGDSDDGAQHTGWLQYMDGSDLQSGWDGRDYADMDEMWFYFKPSNGKMVKLGSGETDIKTQTINGNKYGFDNNGVMVYDWQKSHASDSTPSKYFSDQTDGHMKKKTWVWAVPDEEMAKLVGSTDYNDDTSRWFYVDAQGEAVTSQIKKINGKKYLFDEIGVMKSGLQWVTFDDEGKVVDITDKNTDTSDQIKGGVAGAKLYYFGDEEKDGSMKTGKNIKIELDDDTFTFGFKSNGQAYDYSTVIGTDKDGNDRIEGLVDKKIYTNGILEKASSDDKYTEVGGYLVGTSGTVVSNGKYVKDGDDNWWSVNENGAVVNHGSEDYSKDEARCASQNKTLETTTDKNGNDRYSCK